MSGAHRFRHDVASVWGLVLAVGLILLGQAVEGGSILSLIQPTAALIVFGGTVGAVMVSFSRNDMLRAVRALRTVFIWNGEPLSTTIQTLVQYGVLARKDGILSLDPLLKSMDDPFVEKAVRMLVDATSPGVLRDLLEIEARGRDEYDEIPAKVYEAAGGYAPTIGILGAVIGLIQVMQHLSDPSKLGSGIAVAFVATVYGVGSANLFFLPAATKLRMKARHEARRRELITEGVLAIQDGMMPRIIEEKLYGFAAQATPAQARRTHAA
jgi:chemotaxis protein MotA